MHGTMWPVLFVAISIIIKVSLSIILILLLFAFGIRVFVLREIFKGVCKCKTRLDGKVVIVTGGNSGIGLETAKNLAGRGARVIIASRDVKKSEKVVTDIKAATGNTNVEFRQLNLASKDSIKKFAEEFNKDFDRLDILVNNAGIGAIKSATNSDGIDLLMQINYVGPFHLTQLLLDKLKVSKPSRIVVVSSYAHAFAKFSLEDVTRALDGTVRYCNTKLCGMLWTRELAKRLPEGVTVNSVHPGLVKTNIFNKFSAFYKRILFLIIDLVYKTPLEGAQTIIHLCVSPKLENSTGGYYVDCEIRKPSILAENDILAEKLWNKTMTLIE
ncbi:unnamed protein product, partial [Brenthis ino]